MSPRLQALMLPLLASILVPRVSGADAGKLSVFAGNPDATHIQVDFSYDESPSPVGHPEFVGIDLYRRSVADCGAFVRVNDEPFPRPYNQSFSGSFVDNPPAQQTTYEYKAVPVDADRNAVTVPCDLCLPSGFASSPAMSAPTTRGLLEDVGWTLYLMAPCDGTCYPAVYISNCCTDELRQLADGHTEVSLFGTIGCDGFEGCALTLDHYQVQACDVVVKTRATTWGALKLRYR